MYVKAAILALIIFLKQVNRSRDFKQERLKLIILELILLLPRGISSIPLRKEPLASQQGPPAGNIQQAGQGGGKVGQGSGFE